MKNAASKSINPCDIRAVANFYTNQLQLCCPHSPTSYPHARRVHAHMTTSGFKPRGHILNRLIDVYCKSSHLVSAHQLFDKIPLPDIVARTTMLAAYSASRKSDVALEIFNMTPLRMRDTVFYNAMITAHCHDDDGHAAIELFRDMRREGFPPDNFTFTSVLSALALVADRETHCQQLHCAVVRSGTGLVTSVVNALISVYVKCASSPLVSLSSLMSAARKLFDEMPVRDELTWTTIITGYVRNGDLDTARRVFEGMEEKLAVAWNAMISGYVHNGFVSEALEMFRRMNLSGIKLDEFTYTSVLSACAGLFLFGKQVHAYILRMEHKLSRDFSLSVDNALITLYWKCGKVDEARMIFNNMPVRDLVSWNAIVSTYLSDGQINEARSFFIEMPERNLLTWTVIISGMAQNGLGEEGLKLFNQMKLEGLKPCDYAFAGAISSCAVLAALEHGRQLHAQLVRLGFDSSLSAGNALITMYARCGVVEAAHLYNYLEELGMKMRELGYVPDTKYALHDVGSDQKQHGLSTHSEKLAVVFGLLKLPRGATVRVFKNLRICGDCHNAFKFMSKVVERDIVVRDGKRFHHFRNGELFEILADDKCLPKEQVQTIARQLLQALQYLHSNWIIHRDMKPQNILIGADSVVKLCDFGFARAMSSNTVVLRSFNGTPLYMAPELVRQQPYNRTADLWSLGVILYELFVGEPPFVANSFYTLIRHINEDPVKYPDNMSPNFKSFLRGLLNKEPQNRLTWPSLLQHPFVKETLEELEAKEISASSVATRGRNAAWRGEGKIYMPAGFSGASPDGKNQSPVATGNGTGQCLRSDPESDNLKLGMEKTPREDFPGFTVPADFEPSDRRKRMNFLHNLKTSSESQAKPKVVRDAGIALASLVVCEEALEQELLISTSMFVYPLSSYVPGMEVILSSLLKSLYSIYSKGVLPFDVLLDRRKRMNFLHNLKTSSESQAKPKVVRDAGIALASLVVCEEALEQELLISTSMFVYPLSSYVPGMEVILSSLLKSLYSIYSKGVLPFDVLLDRRKRMNFLHNLKTSSESQAKPKVVRDAGIALASLVVCEEALEQELLISTSMFVYPLSSYVPGMEVILSSLLKSLYSIYSKHSSSTHLAFVCPKFGCVSLIEYSPEFPYVERQFWTPIDGEFDDYIVNPKPSGYQGRIPFSLVVRMHEYAEHGLAAHWLYKETGNKPPPSGSIGDSEIPASSSLAKDIDDQSSFEDNTFWKYNSLKIGHPVLRVEGSQLLAAVIVRVDKDGRELLVAFSFGLMTSEAVADRRSSDQLQRWEAYARLYKKVKIY
ncbi:hypothetical protein RHGRI_008218 [Rhododendron griersonianum]|uniref:Protein kinase domain-containing protein n=1 Tax=Rhododendron griersonianum TaxID=479676 RepID=A0AAV6L104_9ERIC|nr:hypothetical protein RHGRI_008218 [Rhododendron griersonianum]